MRTSIGNPADYAVSCFATISCVFNGLMDRWIIGLLGTGLKSINQTIH
jgi:hypothetical protein